MLILKQKKLHKKILYDIIGQSIKNKKLNYMEEEKNGKS